MSAKTTVNALVVTPATTQAQLDATLYVANQTQILSTATTVATALVAAGQAEGAPVLAIVPVITAAVAAFQGQLPPSALAAQAPFL